MDSDQGKLFIGGISWDTTEEKLRDYFSQYGDVLRAAVMRDKVTDRPRGFGFVVFSDPTVLDRVVRDQHNIGGRVVEVKKALSREEQQMNARVAHTNSGRSSGITANTRTKKIFVGGLPSTLSEDEFRHYFETYGNVTDVVLMYDRDTQRPRGFGFISFDTEEAVDRVLNKTFHDLNGKKVEVKRALPRDAHPYGGNRTTDGGGSYRSNSGYGRMDSNRYSQPTTNSGGFPSYGNSGFGGPGYKYGGANRVMGYGSNSGYGPGNAGFGSHGGAAGYGSPNVPNSAYTGGPRGGSTSRNSWNYQLPSGYGAMGYGKSPWGTSSGGPGSAPLGQSPNETVYNETQAYGNGGYPGSDGSYNTGYGAAGGPYRSATNSASDNGAYYGNGSSDVNDDSGYVSAAWGSHPSQASGNYGPASGPYGGYSGGYGYGGAQTRQSQHP